jgi:hypothetical protein
MIVFGWKWWIQLWDQPISHSMKLDYVWNKHLFQVYDNYFTLSRNDISYQSQLQDMPGSEPITPAALSEARTEQNPTRALG